MSAQALKGRLIQGALAYSGRQIGITLLNLATNLALTRMLFPADFGYIATVSVVLSCAMIVSEGGLGIYLVQRREELTDEDLSRVTTFQLVLCLIFQAALTLGLLMGRGGAWPLLWVSALSLPLSLVKSASMVVLERNLRFKDIAIIEGAEQASHSTTAILLALLGLGVWSVVAASLVKAAVGWTLARNVAPWKWTRVTPVYTRELRKGIAFGLNCQLPAILETVRAAINPFFVGGLLGAANAGFVDRGVIVATLPLALLGGIWRKVLFPYFARIQGDKAIARKTFEEAVYLHSVLDKAAYLPLAMLCPQLVQLVLGERWLPTVPIIYVFMAGDVLFGAFSTTSMAAITGLGKPELLSRWSVVQVIAAWLLSLVLIPSFGALGYAYAATFLWIGLLYTGGNLWRMLDGINLPNAVLKPLLAFCAVLVLSHLFFSISTLPASWPTVLGRSSLGLAGYFGLLLLIDRQHLAATVRRLRGGLAEPALAPTAGTGVVPIA